jgi:hypothetical protein
MLESSVSKHNLSLWNSYSRAQVLRGLTDGPHRESGQPERIWPTLAAIMRFFWNACTAYLLSNRHSLDDIEPKKTQSGRNGSHGTLRKLELALRLSG